MTSSRKEVRTYMCECVVIIIITPPALQGNAWVMWCGGWYSVQETYKNFLLILQWPRAQYDYNSIQKTVCTSANIYKKDSNKDLCCALFCCGYIFNSQWINMIHLPKFTHNSQESFIVSGSVMGMVAPVRPAKGSWRVRVKRSVFTAVLYIRADHF